MIRIEGNAHEAIAVVKELKETRLRQAVKRAFKRTGVAVSQFVQKEVRSRKMLKASAAELKKRVKIIDRSNAGASFADAYMDVIISEKGFNASRFFARRVKRRRNGRTYVGVKINVLGKSIDTGGFTLQRGQLKGATIRQVGRLRMSLAQPKKKKLSKFSRIDTGSFKANQFVVKRKGKGALPLKSFTSMSMADLVKASKLDSQTIEKGRDTFKSVFAHEMKHRFKASV